MLRKNKEQESVRSLTALIGWQILVLAVALMSVSGVAWAAKGDNGNGNGGGGGGGDDSGGTDPVCIAFADVPGDGIQSDGKGLYCNEKKAKIEAVIDQGGIARLKGNTVSHKDPEGGRKLLVDLGRELFLAGPGILFQGTSPSLLHPDIVSHNEQLAFALQDGTDLRAMSLGQTRYDAIMKINISFEYSSGATGALLLSYNPNFSRFGCTGSGSSATLAVTRVNELTWILETDGTDKAALLESFRRNGRPNDEIEIFCHTDPLDNPLGGGEAPFVLPPFTIIVTLAP